MNTSLRSRLCLTGFLGTVYNHSRNVFPTQYSLQISKGCISLALVPAPTSQIRLPPPSTAYAASIEDTVYQVWLQQLSKGCLFLRLVQQLLYQIRYTQSSMRCGFLVPLLHATVYRVWLQLFELPCLFVISLRTVNI